MTFFSLTCEQIKAQGNNSITEFAEEIILDSDVPLARPTASWSVISLVLTLLNAQLALITIYRTRKRHHILHKHDDETYTEFEERKERGLKIRDLEEKKNSVVRVVCLLIAASSIIYFMVTENITLPAAIVNKNSIIVTIFLIAQIVAAFNVVRIKK